MFCISFSSLAEVLKFLIGGKYVNGECRNGKYVNDQCVRKKLIWGKWVTQKYYNKILRPLKEFKVGKKYCLYGTKNWDEACQDAAFEYAFGENWREFKRVALAFIEAQKAQDIEKMKELWAIPSCVSVSNVIHEDGGIGYRFHSATNEEEFDFNLRYWIFVMKEDDFKDFSYDKFLVEDIWGDKKYYTISLNKYWNIEIREECQEIAEEKNCIKIIKIVNFRY